MDPGPLGRVRLPDAGRPPTMTISGSPLKNSLWNLLYRIVSATDHSRTAWSAILRGACLGFFREPIDLLPERDNDGSRTAFRERFFSLPEHRIYDLFEFLLEDDRAGMKEMDRKLVRRSLNEILEQEGAPVRLLRDRFLPLPDSLGIDAVGGAEETMNLFDLPAAARHMESALAYLSRRPEAASQEAVREATLAVAAVVRSLSGETGTVALGTVAPVAGSLGIAPGLLEGMESVLRRCHAVSGLPGSGHGGGTVADPEAAFLVVFCSSTIRCLLTLAGEATRSGGDRPRGRSG